MFFFNRDDKAKQLRLKSMLKKNCIEGKDLAYIIRLTDRWQYQTAEVKKDRLRKMGIRLAEAPIKILDNWLHRPRINGTKIVDNAFILGADFLIELIDILEILNYWKTPVEIVEEDEKMKDLITRIKSFTKLS